MTVSSSFTEIDHWAAAIEHRLQMDVTQRTTQRPPTIRCRFQQGRLLVLVEDDQITPTSRIQKARLRVLLRLLKAVLSQMDLPAETVDVANQLPVRFYLRVRGTVSPYASYDWNWRPQRRDAEDCPGQTEGLPTVVELLPPQEQTANTDGAKAGTLPPEEATAAAQTAVVSPEESALAPLPLIAASDEPAATLEERIPPALLPEHLFHLFSSPSLVTFWRQWPWRSVAALTIAGVAMGGLAYGLSRPCLIGRCDRLEAAAELSATAVLQLENNPAAAQVVQAHGDLSSATRMLASVPPWSRHYGTAQADVQVYRSHLRDLEQILAAQNHGTVASEKSQNPPHPLPLWVEVHLLWQKAIADLQRVSPESPFASFAYSKQAEYEANYAAIGQRLAVEEQAEAALNRALQAAQLATVRTEAATTLSEWLPAQRGWQRAIDLLSQIPQGTLAHQEARELLQEYRPQLSQIRTKVNLEKAGARSYQASQESAIAAQTAEKNRQWAAAADYWRRAHSQGRQVPENTTHYLSVQSQLETYHGAAAQAENRVVQGAALNTLESNLEAVCAAAEDLCTVSQRDQQIRLILSKPYDSAMRQSISPPSAQSSWGQTPSVVEQTHRLIQDVMRLGNQAQLPISVYGTDGTLVGRYRPEYGGFAKK